jgi:Domain of Unknown Function (DUF1206)
MPAGRVHAAFPDHGEPGNSDCVTTEAGRASRGIRTELERPGPSTWFSAVARAGLVSRAAIYVVLAVLAYLIVANGRPPSQASGTGALAEVAKQPAGPFLLALLSAGLLCYGAWRLTQAAAGVEPSVHDRPSAWKRLGWLAIAALYGALFAEAMSILAGSGASGGLTSHPQGAAATVLSWPGGPFVLGLIGAGLAGGAALLGLWSCVYDYAKTLDEHRAPRWIRPATRVVGIGGNLTRAALLALVSSYTFLAAVDDSPSREKSLDQSLEAVAHSTAGPWCIALAATGLLSFAAFSALEARYRRI